MVVTLLMVSSLNGYSTQGDDPHIHAWTSTEDQALFATAIEQSSLIVMGRATYEVARNMMKHRVGRKRVVLTTQPEQYTEQQVPGQLEFTSESPKALVERLEKEGYEEMLLVGGGTLNAAFFEAGLVNEFHLTIEPIFVGDGKPLVASMSSSVSLTLLEMKKLNDRGTVHLRYQVNT